jgi:hypothetical protein
MITPDSKNPNKIALGFKKAVVLNHYENTFYASLLTSNSENAFS